MTEPNNIIDLQPYLDAIKAQEHREQMTAAIMACAEAKSNKPEISRNEPKPVEIELCHIK